MKQNSFMTACFLPAALMLAGLPAVVQAAGSDTAEDTAEVDNVVVYGQAYRTTGTKSALLPLEAPLSYEIYDLELLQQRQADTVNRALRYVPGITPESRATVTIFDQYTIRGFDSYRNYYDGLPLQYNGLWNLAPQVDAFATQSIEVLKGPVSVLYGSAPPGGMVNQTAKQPQATAQTELRLRAGSNNLQELAADTTGPLNDDIQYRVIALSRSKDGQQTTTEEERLTLAPSVTFALGERSSLNLNLYYQKDPDLIPSTPLPAAGTLYGASYGRLDADAYAGDKNWQGMDREVTMLGYKFSHDFANGLTFLQNFRYTKGDALQKNTYNSGFSGDDHTLLRSAYFTDEEIEGWVMDNQLAFILRSGDVRHHLLAGVDYQTLDSSTRYGDTLGTDTPSLDLAAADYDLFDTTTMPFDFYTQNNDVSQKQLGIYLQDEIHWHNLTVIAGLRRDHYQSNDDSDYVYDGYAYSGDVEIDQRATTGRLAAIYTFANGLAPYLSYAESFEPQSGTDTNSGKAFDPTTAQQVEAGIKFRNADNSLTATAAVYDLKKQDVVVNDVSYATYTQTGEVQSRGLELSLRAQLSADLALDLSYSRQDVEVTDNELDPSLEGNAPVWVADRLASAWLNYYLSPQVSLSGGARYVGESQMDAANSDIVPGYTLLDIAASWQLNRYLDLAASVSNLTDKRYVGACYDEYNCWMGAERTAEISLYARF